MFDPLRGWRVLRGIAAVRRVAREAFATPHPTRKRALRGQSLIEREKVASSAIGAVPLPRRRRRRPSILCSSNRIGLDGATPAERLVWPDRGILRGLMLDLGVELRAEQDHDHRDPHPHHHADSRAQRAIRGVIGSEIRYVPGEQRRGYESPDRRRGAADGKPGPARLAGSGRNGRESPAR
jgi:hypothetical protein